MKKLAISLTMLISITGMANAYYLENQTNSADTLARQGYSKSTIQVVDATTYHAQGHGGKYKRVFTQKTKNPYSRIKNYFDPIQDDATFGEHQIEFSNTWNGDNTHYSFPFNASSREVDNL